MKALASIIAYFLPKRVKYIAMLDWMDQLLSDHLTVECPEYSLRIVKINKEDAQKISDFIEKRMVEEAFTIKEPIGILKAKLCEGKNANVCVAEGCYGGVCQYD